MKSIRGSHLEWDATKADMFAEKWWDEHGYSFALKKRYQSKSTYAVKKGEVSCEYDIFNTATNKTTANEEQQMQAFERYFEILSENLLLKQQLKAFNTRNEAQ